MELINNEYVIDGIPVTDLIEKYGTPVYVYETRRMAAQYMGTTSSQKAFDYLLDRLSTEKDTDVIAAIQKAIKAIRDKL